MKIGIMGALPEEVLILKNSMHLTKSTSLGKREYYEGKIGEHEVVLVFSRVGKVASASTATTLINCFNVDLIIFAGVAGAIASHINIGDIVIATELLQHDLSALPLFPKYEVPLLNISKFIADNQLVSNMMTAVNQFLQNEFYKIDNKELLRAMNILTKPSVHTGLIASGDQFIYSLEKRNALLQENPDILCVEMEGAAVAQVCYEYDIPYIIIRTISDNADHSAAIDFKKFVTEIAAYYSQNIILNFIETLKVNVDSTVL